MISTILQLFSKTSSASYKNVERREGEGRNIMEFLSTFWIYHQNTYQLHNTYVDMVVISLILTLKIYLRCGKCTDHLKQLIAILNFLTSANHLTVVLLKSFY